MYLALFYFFAPKVVWADCTITTQKDIAVELKDCENSCSKTFLESGSVKEGNFVEVGCISFWNKAMRDGPKETWECVQGVLQLREDSRIECPDLWTTCKDGITECKNPSWCETKIQENEVESCTEKQILLTKKQADGCIGETRCFPKKFPTSTTEVEVLKTFPIYVNITDLNDTEDTKTYDAVYFLPIGILLFSPIVYALILRTKTFAPCKRLVSILMQICIIALIVYVFITRNHLVKEGIQSIRDDVKHVNLVLLLVFYGNLQIVRFLLPPVYFIFPLDSLFIAVLVMKVSLYEAVAIWQAISCTVCSIGFFLLRYCYSDWANRALESEEIQYFKEVRDFLKVFDDHWKTRFDNATLRWQIIYISSLFNAEFCSAYFGLFWLSVRSRLKPFTLKMSKDWTFICGCILGFILETPAALVQMRLILNALDSVEQSRFELFKGFEWFELVPYLLFTGFATGIVQWNNLSALINKIFACCCRNDGRTLSSNKQQSTSSKLQFVTLKIDILE